MAYEIPSFTLGTQVAAADLTAAQFHFVELDSSGDVALSGAGERAIGVLNNDPDTGEPAEVIVSGVAKVAIGAAVDPGEWVASDANAEAIPATSTAFALGIALTGAANANEVISVLLVSQGHFALA